MLRITQIIDSLEGGGAERMAVSYANALEGKIGFSGLIATRGEGLLKSEINPGVGYLYLRKKNVIDFSALWRLYQYCKVNRINILHAHSSSYFIAVLIGWMLPKMHVIWHDHYGMSDRLDERKAGILKSFSKFFSGIISVNYKLQQWALQTLHCSNVIYLPNFVPSKRDEPVSANLKGRPGKRILCLANLRPQKNHMMLLEVAARIRTMHPEWTFHIVGKDFNDSYSAQIKNKVETDNLSDNVYFYGSRNDAVALIDQCDVFVLTSISEGLPISLLEAGRAQKAVVVTAVGEIPNIIRNAENGMIVPSNDIDAFETALVAVLTNESLRTGIGNGLSETVRENYLDEVVIDNYISWIGKL